MNLRRRVSVLSAFFLLCFCLSAHAQSAPAPKRVVIRAGHLLDVKSGRMVADQANPARATKPRTPARIASTANTRAQPSIGRLHRN